MAVRTTITFAAGLLLGTAVAAMAINTGLFGLASRPAPVRDIVEVETVDYFAARKHRETHFAGLTTIESLQALPSNFDRAEALYALCGRASIAELEVLAYDALRIADSIWRNRALSIVFFRIADVAPEIALEMAMSDDFSSGPALQRRVWRTWARKDLVAATVAAAALNPADSAAAIQDIYASIGGAYNDAARTIEDLSGIGPNSRNRALYLSQLIEDSPSVALEHILQLESTKERRAQMRFMARKLADLDIEMAEQFAERIVDDELRRAYLDRVYEELANDEPQLAFLKQFESRPDGSLTSAESNAFRDLSKNHLDDALRLYEQTKDPLTRAEIALTIAANFAKQRPHEALDWAKKTDGDEMKSHLQEVITELARNEPELALREAQEFDHPGIQVKLASKIISTLAKESPRRAAQHLGLIEDASARSNAAVELMDEWLQEDAQAAVDWALNSEPEIATRIFSGRSARHMDLDTAQILVPAIPEEYRGNWARSVARELVEKRSAQDAYLFVDQFKGSADYDLQMANLIGQVAAKEPHLALQWANDMPVGNARDAAISSVTSSTVHSDPGAAANMLEQIGDSDLRQVASAEVMARWQSTDPQGVRQWIDAMPRGADRDNIIMNTALSSARSSEETLRMLNTIDDPAKRQEALLMHSLNGMRDNPEEMMKQLDQIEMPELMRQQIKAGILRSAARGR